MALQAHLECVSLHSGKPIPVPEQTVLCLGNFDGVHLGHRALIREAIRLSGQTFSQAMCGAFCFRELSSDLLLPDPPEHLTTPEERMELFRDAGLDFLILADFAGIRALSPKEFVADILQTECHCAAAVCGFNYRFGKGAVGGAEELRSLLGGPVLVCQAVEADGAPISSTRIRAAVKAGNVDEAARLLGHPYALSGLVLHGKELGRKLGFPTANQNFQPFAVIPKNGVYVTHCTLDGQIYRGVSNVGKHPTVDPAKTPVNCETYLIGYNGDLYGKELKVEFLRFLRPERSFASVEELKAQIARDAEAASRI